MALGKWLQDNIGDTTTPITSDKANANFMGFYVSNSDAAGGTARGMYMRLYLTGTSGQSGEAVRAFTTVNGTGGVGVHGIHASLSMGTSGTVTGEGAAVRATLQLPNKAVGAGTLASLYSELSADGSSTTTSGVTNLAFMRAVLAGDTTGAADIEDNCALLSLEGGSIASGNLIAAKSSAAVTHVIRILVNGVKYYLMVSNQV